LLSRLLRQDNRPALHRGPLHVNGVCEIDGEVWQNRDGAFLPTYRRPLGYVFQEASLFRHLSVRRNRDAAKGAIAFDEVALTDCSTGRRATSRAANARESRSGARCCRSRSFC
jgi:ABC-type Fe3+/spermidine/putrescine transport system ATPase subunit